MNIQPDEKGTYQVLSVIAGDRPGLLSRIARVLTAYDINLHTAKINTLGARAEDVFLVSGAALKDPEDGGAAGERAGRAAAHLSQCSVSGSEGPIQRFNVDTRLASVVLQVLPGKQLLGEAEVAQVADAHRVEDARQVVAFVLHDARVEVRSRCDRSACRTDRRPGSAAACSAAPARACRAR